MSITFTTYGEMHDVIVNSLLPKIPTSVTKVIGIPRSGLVPASMISLARHIQLGAYGFGDIPGGDRSAQYMGPEDGTVLVIDDTVDRGKKMAEAAESVKAQGRDVIRACVFVQPGKEHLVDIYGQHRSPPRLFEWNLFNHGLGPRMMFDLDGVFCSDPEAFDDDGPAYCRALETAKPLRLSKWPVGVICTNRIERWRGITEAWLKKHGVNYGQLLMNPAKTAEDRRKIRWLTRFIVTGHRRLYYLWKVRRFRPDR